MKLSVSNWSHACYRDCHCEIGVFLFVALAPNDIAGMFSSGYLFGSLLHKHGIQEDFAKFTDAK